MPLFFLSTWATMHKRFWIIHWNLRRQQINFLINHQHFHFLIWKMRYVIISITKTNSCCVLFSFWIESLIAVRRSTVFKIAVEKWIDWSICIMTLSEKLKIFCTFALSMINWCSWNVLSLIIMVTVELVYSYFLKMLSLWIWYDICMGEYRYSWTTVVETHDIRYSLPSQTNNSTQVLIVLLISLFGKCSNQSI